MGNESGEWIMYGTDADDPNRIKSIPELIQYINKVGFLPLFRNSVPGFSVEEHTLGSDWWSGDPERDPWEWRQIIAADGEVAYGKFFGGKAGFISLQWLPYFANWRRDGYDFDARWDDGKANFRSKRIMDILDENKELPSYEIKQRGGFGKDGQKNFDGTVTNLQMQIYIVIRDFRQRTNKAGQPYGWSVAVYSMPENIWGYDLLSSAYSETPESSRDRIYCHVQNICPEATMEHIRKLLK